MAHYISPQKISMMLDALDLECQIDFSPIVEYYKQPNNGTET